MATDLFNKYFTDPKKQYVYTNMSCKSSTGDTNFTISGDAAVISDENNELASLDLSSIKEYITDWRNETRVIEPYQITYFRGFSEGYAYQRNIFVSIPQTVLDDEDYLYTSELKFSIKCYLKGCPKILSVHAVGSLTSEKTFIEDAQEKIDAAQIPVTISTEDEEIKFESTVLGYDFYVLSDLSSNTVKFYSPLLPVDPSATGTGYVYLYDFAEGFVAPKKYRNGAFRGIVIKPTYPQFENDDIDSTELSLEIAHIKNRIETYESVTCQGVQLYEKHIKDVIDSYNEVAEIENFNRWRESVIGNAEDYPCDASNGTNEETAESIVGLYGFINWVQKNKAWTKFGSLYSIVCPPDLADYDYHNLIDSFVIYNPNPYPVKVSCLLMA